MQVFLPLQLHVLIIDEYNKICGENEYLLLAQLILLGKTDLSYYMLLDIPVWDIRHATNFKGGGGEKNRKLELLAKWQLQKKKSKYWLQRCCL